MSPSRSSSAAGSVPRPGRPGSQVTQQEPHSAGPGRRDNGAPRRGACIVRPRRGYGSLGRFIAKEVSMDGKDFFSSDGTTIVLSNGTVLTGHLDKSTGIFTANDGSSFFIGNNGIEPAKPEPDGSYQLPDGSTVMTPKEWSVDLPALHDA